MALVNCPYCEAKISEKAISCPKCGKSTLHKKINILSAYKKLWRRAFDYKGFSGREEYWLGIICAGLIHISFGILANLFNIISANSNSESAAIFFALSILILISHGAGVSIALIASIVRRFRDSGTNPIGVFFLLIPILGLIYVAYICTKKSKRDAELTFLS